MNDEKNLNNEVKTEAETEIEPKQIKKEAKPKKKKSILRRILGWIVYLAVVAGLIYGIPRGLSAWLNTDTPIAAITSGSMWPALKKGDLILIQAVSKDELKVGDIVVYANEKGFTIHRIIELKDETLVTKGDANNIQDLPVKYEDVKGRTLTLGSKPLRIPKLGLLSVWAGGLR